MAPELSLQKALEFLFDELKPHSSVRAYVRLSSILQHLSTPHYPLWIDSLTNTPTKNKFEILNMYIIN